MNTELARIFPFTGEIRPRLMKPHKSASRTSDGCTRLKLSLQGVCERQVQGFRRVALADFAKNLPRAYKSQVVQLALIAVAGPGRGTDRE